MMSMERANSSSARARISGTAMVSSVVCLNRSRSSWVNPASAETTAPRTAASGLSPAGWAFSASRVSTSISSCRTTSSFVGKYR